MGTSYKNYSWLSLLEAVVFYKVTANAEFANTEPLLLGEYGVRFPRNSGDNISWTRQYIALFCVSFCLKILSVMYFVDSLTLNSGEQHYTRAWRKLI